MMKRLTIADVLCLDNEKQNAAKRKGRDRSRQSEVFFPLADHANLVLPPGIWPGLIQNRPDFRSCHRHLR